MIISIVFETDVKSTKRELSRVLKLIFYIRHAVISHVHSILIPHSFNFNKPPTQIRYNSTNRNGAKVLKSVLELISAGAYPISIVVTYLPWLWEIGLGTYLV